MGDAPRVGGAEAAGAGGGSQGQPEPAGSGSASAPTPTTVTPSLEPELEFSTVRDKLRELEQLRQEGLIDEAEYRRLRKRVLEYF